jgi:hypothetical protein
MSMSPARLEGGYCFMLQAETVIMRGHKKSLDKRGHVLQQMPKPCRDHLINGDISDLTTGT